jgi:hypothetical protein
MQPIRSDDLHAAFSRAGMLALRAEFVSRLPGRKPTFRDNSHDLAYGLLNFHHTLTSGE